MSKLDLGQTVNTLANIGVIAGIVFLGIELSQNNDILEAERLAALSAVSGSAYKAILDNPDMAALILKDRQGAELSDQEDLLLSSFWMSALYDAQSAFLLSPEGWSAAAPFAALYAVQPTFRRAWDGQSRVGVAMRRTQFDPRFAQALNEAIRASE